MISCTKLLLQIAAHIIAKLLVSYGRHETCDCNFLLQDCIIIRIINIIKASSLIVTIIFIIIRIIIVIIIILIIVSSSATVIIIMGGRGDFHARSLFEAQNGTGSSSAKRLASHPSDVCMCMYVCVF